jgi:hypothetical protein
LNATRRTESAVATPDRPRLAQNPITGSGIFLTTVSAAVFLSFFAADLFGIQMNPYFGIIFYLAVPSLFVLGLLLIPAGLVRERRRRLRGLPPTHWHWPRVDMNDAFVRRVVAGIAVLTMVNVIIIGLAAYKGV